MGCLGKIAASAAGRELHDKVVNIIEKVVEREEERKKEEEQETTKSRTKTRETADGEDGRGGRRLV